MVEHSQHLPTADGTWEWAQYQSVKDRIRSAKHSRRELFAPKPLDLLDVDTERPSAVAKRIVLPAPGRTPDVSIILPVFNNLKLTLECLLSISQHADPSVTFEILVRDDASTDDTVKIISEIKNVRIVRNPENVGFLRNCNRALESVRGQYVVFLNNDVQVTPGWLRTLLDTFSNYPSVGAVGPQFLYPSGHLQEAGAAFRPDGTAEMVGLNEDPDQPRFSYVRRVDYTSGACLMLPTTLVKELDGFSEEFLPCYCEDSDLCLRVQEKGYFVYCNPGVTIVHHLSKTTASINEEFKYRCVAKNLNSLASKWAHVLDRITIPRVLAFYLPQFYPFAENNQWWGEGFTEWTNVTKAQPNFEGHYQPRLPANLGYYDLRLSEVMVQQAELARSHGIDGFCFYYYWFDGKRLLDAPVEQMLALGKPDFPFCLCWANENWSRRWDGQDREILMAQAHSPKDDIAVIADLSRYFQDRRYIRIDGRPLVLIYRVQLFPNFAETAARWRAYCLELGLGEIYIAMVESFELVHSRTHPRTYGCDAAVEFPPQELAEPKPPSGTIVNPRFKGSVGDFRDLAVKFATRDLPNYTRFMGVAPGWDNTARMQDKSFCFEYATPGAFQAWLEEAIELTRAQHYGDERLIFVNAWNEWAEGAYLEPDRRFGQAFLDAVRNAKQAATLLRKDKYALGG
jgi:GT2 family glycosyltransferase